MSQQIPTAFVKQFSSAVQHLVQQKGSKLRNSVDVRSGLIGESAFVDQIGSVKAGKKTSRHTPIVFTDTPHARRRITSNFFFVADALDTDDALKIIIANPTGQIAQAHGFSLGRQIDDVIIPAFNGISFTGVDGATQVTFPASQQVAANFVETGAPAASDLTVGKIRRASEILNANEVDPDNRMIVIGSAQLNELLQDPEVTDADFSTLQALMSGTLMDRTYLGFRFILSERLPKAGDIRSVFAYHRSGMILGIWQDVITRVDERTDLASIPKQVHSSIQIGSTRLEEEKVVEILCDEAA